MIEYEMDRIKNSLSVHLQFHTNIYYCFQPKQFHTNFKMNKNDLMTIHY